MPQSPTPSRSPSPTLEEAQTITFSVKVIARVTFHSLVKSAGASKSKAKQTTKDVKEVRAKEFDYIFQSNKGNYVQLLKKILEKHYIADKLDVSEKRVYACKILVPPAKQADACDVVNFEEYVDVVKKIFASKKDLQNGKKSVTIFVDTASIDKAAKKKNSEHDDDESVDEDDGDGDDVGLSKIDFELARLRGLLEKKYANDHDVGYTYIDSVSAESTPLTPFMLKEWARAMYDGVATVHRPPNSTTFDPAIRKPSIAGNRRRSESATASTSSGSDSLSCLTQIMTSVVALARPDHATAIPTTPQRPTKVITPDPTPARNTPSKLKQYLDFAEKQLGVTYAKNYEHQLRNLGFGPDILHLIDNQELVKLGVSQGDAIRLTTNAPIWWNGLSRKRSRDETAPAAASVFDPDVTPPQKKFRFEKRYPEGGLHTVFGPCVVEGDPDPNADFTWYWYSKELKQTVPLPRGVVPVLEGEEDDDNWGAFH